MTGAHRPPWPPSRAIAVAVAVGARLHPTNPAQEFTAMPQYHVVATTSASVSTVWSLLIDGRSWPRWSSGLDELVEERSIGLDPGGHDDVGAVRAFRTSRVVTGERLTELVDGRRLAYEDAFNLSIKNYRAVVQLEPTSAGGTTIDWHGTWRMRAGIGWVTPLFLARAMRRMAIDLADYAATVQVR